MRVISKAFPVFLVLNLSLALCTKRYRSRPLLSTIAFRLKATRI